MEHRQLIKHITNIVANGFHPAEVTILNKNLNGMRDRITNYFYPKNFYSNQIFEAELDENKFKYNIKKQIEPEVLFHNKFFDYPNEYRVFKLTDNKFSTNGNINYRHLLMLKDFSNFDINIKPICNNEFESYKNAIQHSVESYTEKELLEMFLGVFDKIKSFKYDYNIKVHKSPSYDYSMVRMFDEKFYKGWNQMSKQEIQNDLYWIKWLTADQWMSPPARLFSLKSQNYSSISDIKLFYNDTTKLNKWNIEYKLIPYTTLFKYEGRINFEYMQYTYWSVLLKFVLENYKDRYDALKFYSQDAYELRGRDNYDGHYIPISELILFTMILDKGASTSYNFNI